MIKPERLPTTESEWLQTGVFQIGMMDVLSHRIKYASVAEHQPTLVTMIGGIPRDPARRSSLAVIPKLFGQLAWTLKQSGVGSLLYNHPGLGCSSGDLQSLRSMTKVLVQLLVKYSEGTNIHEHVLVGSSAGAYMAIRAVNLLREVGVKVGSLVLIAPPVFPLAIESVPYGPNFTAMIRQPWDFRDSPAFSALDSFVCTGGKLFVCYCQFDTNIPAEIQQLYIKTLVNLRASGLPVEYWRILGVTHYFCPPHGVAGYVEADDNCIRLVAQRLSGFIKQYI